MLQILNHRKMGSDGYTLLGVLVGFALLAALTFALMNTMTVMNRAHKGVSETADIDEVTREMSLILQNTAVCTCIFSTINPTAGAVTAPPYSFDQTNLPAGIRDTAAANPPPITIAPWNTGCLAPGNVVSNWNGGAPVAVPNTNNLQIQSLSVQGLQALGQTYIANLAVTFQKANAAITIGSPVLTRNIPVAFGVTVLAPNNTRIDGCVQQTQQIETKYYVSYSANPSPIIAFIPLNDLAFGLSGNLNLVLSDGVMRTVTIGAGEGAVGLSEVYQSASHGIATNTAALPAAYNPISNIPPNPGENNWYYVYAIPRLPPHPEAVGGNANASRLAFVASVQPPWLGGPGGLYTAFPYRYVTAAKFDGAGSAWQLNHRGGNKFFFQTPIMENIPVIIEPPFPPPPCNATNAAAGTVAWGNLGVSTPLTSNAVILEGEMSIIQGINTAAPPGGCGLPGSAGGNYYQFISPSFYPPLPAAAFLTNHVRYRVGVGTASATGQFEVPLAIGNGLKAIQYMVAPTFGAPAGWGYHGISSVGYVDNHITGN